MQEDWGMTKQYYSEISEVNNRTVSDGAKDLKQESRLEIRLNDGVIMYVNVDQDGWVEMRFSDNWHSAADHRSDYCCHGYQCAGSCSQHYRSSERYS